MPEVGSVQKFGDTCSDELRLTLRLVAIVLALRPSWAARARSICGVEGRRIDFLLQMRVGDAGYGGEALAELLGDREIVGAVVADRADVDLRRQAEVQDLRHHVGGLEIERILREGLRQHLAQFRDVISGRRCGRP